MSLYLYRTDPKVAVLEVSVDDKDLSSESASRDGISENIFDNFCRVLSFLVLSLASVPFALLYL
jgi:hypothetical protein